MIVFPMAGLSSRFFRAGYTKPKYQLPLHGRSIFSHVVSSFNAYANHECFAFIFRPEYDAQAFIEHELTILGIHDYLLIELPFETVGQAHTVYLGTRSLSASESLTVFNIDTLRPGFQHPDWISGCDGYLEVFQAEGSHWSFIAPGPELKVLRTTEKERISSFCSDGLYYFRQRQDFDEAFLEAFYSGQRDQGELYIAPLYNLMINQGQRILYRLIGDHEIYLCGTPVEYQQLLSHHL